MEKPLSTKVKEKIEELGGKTLYFNEPDFDDLARYPDVAQYLISDVCKDSKYNSLFAMNDNYAFMVVCSDLDDYDLYNVALIDPYGAFCPFLEHKDIVLHMNSVGVVQCFALASIWLD